MNSIKLKKIFHSLRPPKVVTLIHKGQGWREKSLKIIETYNQVWGGDYNLIIPTDGEKIDECFWFLLEKYDPDYFFIYNNPNNRTKHNFISDELKKEILKRLNPFYDNISINDPIQNNFFYPDNKNYPLTLLSSIFENTELDYMAIHNPSINYNGSKIIKDNLELMGYSILGKMTDQYVEKLTDLSFGIDERDIHGLELLNLIWESKITSNEYEAYPSQYSMIKLSKYLKNPNVTNGSPIIVVTGDTLEDFCLYYNLSKMRHDVLWAPYSIIKNSLIDLKRFLEGKSKDKGLLSFNHSLLWEIRRKTSPGKNAIITSTSKSIHELEKVKTMLNDSCLAGHMFRAVQSCIISKNINDLLNYTLQVFELDNQPKWYVEQFVNCRGLNPVDTPIPRNFNLIDKEHYWISEINIEGYKLPLKKVLGDVLIFQDQYYSNNYVRVSKEGFSYFCPALYIPTGMSIEYYLVKPEIRLFEPCEIFNKIYDEFGYIIITSDKGNYERESTKKFGSLERISEFFQKEKYQNLFFRFVQKENPKSPDEGIFLKDDNRLYMTIKSIESILGDEINPIINDFVGKKILHRGFIFKCEKCKYTGWYGIEDVDNKFKCRRCRSVQYYNSKHLVRQNPVEPEWFYKLDESVYQGYDNDMIVPILTLNNLKNLSKESFLYTPEIEIRKKDNPDKQYREIDICCISDGKIIIGECKIHNKLEEEEIKKYVDIYKEIGAEKIVFSTFAEKGWSDGTLRKIKNILGEEINYTIFIRKDLC